MDTRLRMIRTEKGAQGMTAVEQIDDWVQQCVYSLKSRMSQVLNSPAFLL